MAAILTGIFALLYSVAFVIIARTDAGLGGLLSALFLMLTGLATIPLFVALYSLLQDTDADIALWARRFTAAMISLTPSIRLGRLLPRYRTCRTSSTHAPCLPLGSLALERSSLPGLS